MAMDSFRQLPSEMAMAETPFRVVPPGPGAADPDDDSPEAIAARTDFGDLEAQDGACEIEDTAERSMALTQLIRVCQHLERRLSPSWSCFGTTISGEEWKVGRPKEGGGFKNDHLITSWDEVNLYDADK